jgi:membrane fusion protein (multidrug efflux system)
MAKVVDTAAENPAPEAKKTSNRTRIFGVAGGLAVLVLLTAGFRSWLFNRSHVSTDDAQVDGHIIPVSPKIGGFVAGIRAEENSQVREGDTLVVIDDRDYQSRLVQTDAELAALVATIGTRGQVGQAVAQLDAARAAAASAAASVTQAEANAQRAANDLERYQALAGRNVISKQQLETAETTVSTTQAQVVAARQNAQQAEAQVTVASAALRGADARVAAARASRDQAALALSYTRIVAPASGVVSKKNVEVGQLMQPGQPMMTVVPLDDIWVTANLKETQIENVLPGDSALIAVDAYPGVTFHAHVESVSPATGAKFSLLPPDNATGNFTKVVQRVPVRLRLNQGQDPKHLLRPGMSVDVAIQTR